MDAQTVIDQIYTFVENGAVDKAVFSCVRLARKIEDTFNLIIFLREISSDKKQFISVFVEETRTLCEETQKFLWEKTGDHWMAGRTVDYLSGYDEDEEKGKVLLPGIGELQREIEHFERCIRDMEVPAGMLPYDTAAFTDRYVAQKQAIRDRMRANQTVIERIRTRCLNYASRIEKQLAVQSGNEHFLDEIQASVNNFFAARSEDVYTKLLKAGELARSSQSEDHALMLTSVRRAIKAVSDYFYPPSDKEVCCYDGTQRQMRDEHYLNRLQEFCMRSLTNSSSDSMAKEELSYLCVFLRRLNDVTSKGVHAEVSHREARQGLVGIYLFLSNLISRIESDPISMS